MSAEPISKADLLAMYPYLSVDLHMDLITEAVYDEDNKILGVIYYDNDPQNPRQHNDCNLTCIFVPRGGPVQGDTDDLDELYELLGRKGCDIDWDEWEPARKQDLIAVCDEWGIELRPLYAYVHGSATVSLSPFSCKWDSGQCGWVWVDRDDPEVKRVAARNDKGIDSIFNSEVEMFDQYVRGDVYGIGVYKMQDDGHPDLTDCEEVWGFFGLDYAREKLEDMIENGD